MLRLYARYQVPFYVPDLFQNFVIYFKSMYHFNTPRKRQKTRGSVRFLGIIEMKHWLKVG